MHILSKKYYKLILTIILFPSFCTAQNTGCLDSISFSKYYSQFYGGNLPGAFTQKDQLDNFYINAGTSIGVTGYNAIIKFNSANKLVWYKNYRFYPAITEIAPAGLSTIDSKANLFFVSSGKDPNTNRYRSFLSKFDSSGNFIWGRRTERTDAPLVDSRLFDQVTTNDNGDQFYIYLNNDDYRNTNITKLMPMVIFSGIKNMATVFYHSFVLMNIFWPLKMQQH